MDAGEDTVVAVSYELTKDDVRGAARVAAKALPARRKLKRVLLVLIVVGALLFDAGLLNDGSVPLMTGGLTMMLLSGIMITDRYFAYAVVRSHVAREFLLKQPGRSFQADADGVTFTAPTSTGTHAWSAIQDLVDDPRAVVFVLSSQAFQFLPGRVLSERDRAALQALRKPATATA